MRIYGESNYHGYSQTCLKTDEQILDIIDVQLNNRLRLKEAQCMNVIVLYPGSIFIKTYMNSRTKSQINDYRVLLLKPLTEYINV